IDAKMFDNKDILLSFAKRSGCEAFENYLSYATKSDRDFMLKCIEKNGCMIKVAAYKLRNDKDFALTAVKQNSYAYFFVSDDLKADDDFKRTAKEQGDFSLENYLTATNIQEQYNDYSDILSPEEII
ncbi:MAG TPA: hypothetical protein DEQ88_04090, partial [Clostridiales bacterium]|nr:hypothetical protein [Clostridiales bacterium]